VVSAINNLISDAKKPTSLQEKDPKPDQNKNRNNVYYRLVEEAFVDKRWRGYGRNKGGRA
jgi:hypothetical protein